MDGKIDNKQFGGISGTSTTDVLLEMVNKWYEATDNLDSYVRVVMLYFIIVILLLPSERRVHR